MTDDKAPVSATPEAAACMLEVIRASEVPVGLKVSGGVVTIEDVERYVALAAQACAYVSGTRPRASRCAAASSSTRTASSRRWK